MKVEISSALIAGGFGGIATSLFNLATNLVGGTATWQGLVTMALGSIGFILLFVIGVAVVHFFEEADMRKAFIIGLSLPAFFAAAASGDLTRLTGGSGAKLSQSNPKQLESNRTDSKASGMSSARKRPAAIAANEEFILAQGLQAQPYSTESTLRIMPAPDAPGNPPYDLWFFDQRGIAISKHQIPELSQPFTYEIPENAKKFGIWNDLVTPKVYELPDLSHQDAADIYLNFNRSYFNDVLRGLGAKKYKPYNPDYSFDPRQP